MFSTYSLYDQRERHTERNLRGRRDSDREKDRGEREKTGGRERRVQK
jgi:hypothetical protein